VSNTATIYRARGTALDTAADDVQIMPPGKHAISPMGADGKPVDLEVQIDATTAEILEAARARYQAAADSKTGDAPYFDFNHDDGPAAAWVKSIYWAGDDPQTGGVRAKVEWTDAGLEAVNGRLFRRFSPCFCVDEKTGAINGAPVNMGGLVNRAAFRTIAALFSKSTTNPTMNEEQIAALQKENEDLKAQIAELTGKVEAAAKKDAEAQVDCAATEGRIPPAPEVKAKWVRTLLADPAAAELLASLPKNAALEKVIDAKAAEPTTADLRAQFEALPREERPAFFAKHKAALLSK
jgi:phage I-like protein